MPAASIGNASLMCVFGAWSFSMAFLTVSEDHHEHHLHKQQVSGQGKLCCSSTHRAPHRSANRGGFGGTSWRPSSTAQAAATPTRSPHGSSGTTSRRGRCELAEPKGSKHMSRSRCWGWKNGFCRKSSNLHLKSILWAVWSGRWNQKELCSRRHSSTLPHRKILGLLRVVESEGHHGSSVVRSSMSNFHGNRAISSTPGLSPHPTRSLAISLQDWIAHYWFRGATPEELLSDSPQQFQDGEHYTTAL